MWIMEKTNSENNINEFLKFESMNAFFNKKFQNVHYWPLIRFSLYRKIQNEKQNIGQAHTSIAGEPMVKRISYKFKQFKNMIIYNPLLYRKKIDLLVLNHQRRVKDEDQYRCVYTDDFLESTAYQYVILEEPYLEQHYRPVPNDNILYTDYINLMVAIKRRISALKPLKKEEKHAIQHLVELLNETFNMTFTYDDIKQSVTAAVCSFKHKKRYYKKILKRTNPQAILEVVSYGGSRYVVNALAKEMNIPTIELQHGTMGKYHLAYNFKEKMNLSTFPDYIFTFGQFWKDVTRFPIADDKVKVVGWPYFERKLSYYKSHTNKSNASKTTILFISQGTIGKALSDFAVKFSELIDISQYHIIYKLHPGEYNRWEKEYPWLKDTDIEVIDHNQHDMHYYFAQADIQVGVYSTALFEGLGYNLQTAIVDLPNHEYMEELIKSGQANFIEKPLDLYKFIKRCEKKELDHLVQYLWSFNSLKALSYQIEKVLQNQ